MQFAFSSFVLLILSIFYQLSLAKTSFNLSELKRRQHRHAHHHPRREFLPGLGPGDGNSPLDPIDIFPPASSSQSSVSSMANPQQSDTADSSPTTPAGSESTSSSGGLLGLPGLGPGGGILPSIPLLPQPTPPPSPPQGPDPTPTGGSGDGGGLPIGPIGSILNPVTSIIGPVLSPVTSVIAPVTSVLSPVTSILQPVTSVVGPILSPVTSILSPVTSILEPITSILPVPTILPSDSSSSGSGDPTDSVPPIISLSIPPIGGSSTDGIGLPSLTLPSISISIPTLLPSSSSDSSSSGGSGIPPITIPNPFPTSSVDSSPSQAPSSVPTPTSSGGSSNSSTLQVSSTTIFQTPPTASPGPTTSIGTQFSFITESSLQVDSVTTEVPSPTQTDPDVPTTTISAPSGTTPAPSPSLPPNLPDMILPNPPLDTSPENLAGMTLITLLFEPQLGYEFILSHEQSQGQIWAYMPIGLGDALSITPDEVKALWLKPYAQVDYSGDPADLLTLYNAYIPSATVDNLANQISTKTSKYFSGLQGIPSQLANFTIPGFPILYMSDPYSSSTNGGNGPGSTSVAATREASEKRRNAIIAVCSIIGGIALLVLAWWGYKTYQRRQESAHQRLRDPLGYGQAGYGATSNTGMRQAPPAPPSVGPDGVRRNSFYFAEDSLRGYRDRVRDMEEETQLATSVGSRGRVQGAPISTPILRQTTLAFDSRW